MMKGEEVQGRMYEKAEIEDGVCRRGISEIEEGGMVFVGEGLSLDFSIRGDCGRGGRGVKPLLRRDGIVLPRRRRDTEKGEG
jgi:hypothetical protein